MNDFFFPHTGPLALGGAVEKFRGNIAAIKALKLCQADNRPATSEEQHILAHYVGWGDSAVLKQSRDAHELNALLTDEERRGLQASSLNAHFTDISVIAAIWDGLIHAGLGSHAFRVIDPSAGVGHFKSAMPDGLRPLADWVEVELDPLTAGILELLHPESKIFPQGYEEVELPQEWFDLAISNVPFGDYPVASAKTPKFLRHCIHDFFFANTVPALCPGGIMAFITSRYTMDKKDSEVRQWLARRLELLAAVRLPDNAFRKNAGTEVVTDILIFQKRTDETTERPAWVESEDVAFQHNHRKTTEPINRYFIDHPEMVLGIPSLTGSMYRGDSYTVEPVPDQDLGAAIRQALISALPSGVIQPIQAVTEQVKAAPVVITTAEKAPNPEQQRRIDAMHTIYRAAKAVLASEIDGRSLAETSTLRETLNKIYDAFAGIYGPINFPSNTRLLQGSAELPFLKALEIYDTTQATSKKAGIFQAPMVRAINRSEALSVTDGLLLSLDRKGYVDIAYIAAMTHSFEADVIQQLGERIFELPQGGWETSDAYLSGNIVQKLREAKAATALDSKFVRNAQALNAVLPEPLKPGEIRAPLGAGWVPMDVVGQFFEHLLTTAGAPYRVTYIPGLANWTVEGYRSYYIPDGLEHGRWGTGRYGAIDLIVDGLNAHTPVVYDPDPNDPNGRIINQVETIAAQAKLAEIKEEFERWLWNDLERAQRLATIYNERFNAYRVREYDGSHLSFPGLNKAITLRPHQANMVWRTLQSETAAVGHKVGMGKTLVGIVSMMEAKRLGLTKKAMVVVPNHLTGQWYAQAIWAYPNANILCVTASDLTRQNRGRFLSSIATNDWDLVIVPFSSFKLLPCSGKTMTDYFQREIDQLEEYLWELKAEKSYSRAVKEIEKTIKRFKVKLANAADMAKDSQETVTWEQLGVEMLVVDEFHCLPYESRVLTNLGYLPIGEIVEKRIPVLVKSVDLSTHEIKWMPITGWFNNSQSAPMVRVEHEQGVLECTANHRIWTEEEGYVEAGKLTKRHTLKNLPNVQKRICAEPQRKTRTEASSLFSRVPEKWIPQNSDKILRAVRDGIFIHLVGESEQRQETLLRQCMRGNMAHGTAGTQGAGEGISSSDVGSRTGSAQRKTFSCSVSSHEGKQSKSNRGMEKENVGDHVWTHVSCPGWQRNSDSTARSSGECTGHADGIPHSDHAGEGPIQVSTDQLQSGYSRSGSKVSDRNRRSLPSDEEVEVSGQTKNGSAERSRVVSVTFLESESGFRSAVGAGRNTRVYCLEVAETHNFFAEGVLVSNCFKNLFFGTRMTRIAGLSNTDSQRAFDMFVKSRWLIERGGKFVGMSGTLVTNTIAELFTMQRYFQQDELQALGLSQFDAWANQFAVAEPGLEMTPDGSGFRMNTRFRKFVNVPELMKLFLQVADLQQFGSTTGIERPDLYNGKPVNVVSDGGPDLKEFVNSLAERTEKIRTGLVDPRDDNMLLITGEGRKAALDLSLVRPTPPDASMPKIDALVDIIASIYEASEAVKGTQLVFCDLATPKPKR